MPEKFDGSKVTPIVRSTVFEADETIDASAIRYPRLSTLPGQLEVARALASAEGGEAALVTSSGMAAVTTTLLALLAGGGHALAQRSLYGATQQFLTRELTGLGASATLVDVREPNTWTTALTERSRVLYVEAITNPLLEVADHRKIVQFARQHGLVTIIDNTFASPINFRPLQLGFDVVVHSATKYLGGHNDVLAGLVAGKSGLVSLVRDVRHMMGAVCDPYAAWLVHRGLKTLALRVAHQNEAAMAIARFLEAESQIEQVWYPGLESHACHDVARRTMDGFGGMVTFAVRGDLEATGRFIDALQIPRIAPSMGGVESLVEQPALMSYFELSTEQREKVGIKNNLVRYSVGIESADDLIEDLRQALQVL